MLYELHIGACGGHASVERRLPEIAALGVTAIELMPVNTFPGARNWGYDGVLPFAPDPSYGRPEELKALIDAAHGPGCRCFSTSSTTTSARKATCCRATRPRSSARTGKRRGAGDRLSREQTSAFFIENALYWLHEFRFDGLRIDAAHAIDDDAWLRELARRVRAYAGDTRHVHLVLENERNAASLLGAGGFDAQWNDDFHNSAHVLLTGERDGYYRAYADAPRRHLARTLGEGFAYQGEPSPLHDAPRAANRARTCRRPRSSRSCRTTTSRQPRIRRTAAHARERRRGARGDRAAAARAVDPAAVHGRGGRQHPAVPVLHRLSRRTRRRGARGRRREFAAFPAFADAAHRDAIPDPNDIATFVRSTLHGSSDETTPDTDAWRRFYRSALTVRAALVTPNLPGASALGVDLLAGDGDPQALAARWRLGDGSTLTIALNLGSHDAVLPALPVGKIVFETPPRARDRLRDLRLPPRACIAWRDGKVNHDARQHRMNGQGRS